MTLIITSFIISDLIRFYRYKPNNPSLKKVIQHFWTFESVDKTTCIYEMLPGYNVDIIFDFSSPNKSSKTYQKVALKEIYISGVNEKYSTLNLDCKLDIIGILFYTGAAYSFLKIPLKKVKGLLNLNIFLENFSLAIHEKINQNCSPLQRIHMIEQELVDWINIEYFPCSMTSYALKFLASCEISIENFCYNNGIHRRKLERYFDTFIGMSPKRFQKVHRIQNAIIKIISCNYTNLSSVAYECGFYDQSHFIREFNFTGLSPQSFINKNIKEKNKSNKNIKSAIDIFSSPY